MRKSSCKLKTGFVKKIAAIKHPKKDYHYVTLYNPSNGCISCGLSGTNFIYDEIVKAKKGKLKIKVFAKKILISIFRKEFINIKFLLDNRQAFSMNGHFDQFIANYRKSIENDINRLTAKDSDGNKKNIADLKLLLK